MGISRGVHLLQTADSGLVTRAPHPYLDGPRPRAFAHRGWHVDGLEGLENTLVSFHRAAAEGYAYVETDVHATADGVLVVHHDATLRRVADHPGVLRTMSWADLADVRVGGQEPLPRLEQALEELPETRFNVDLKSPAALGPMLRLLEDDDVAARVAVASTDENRVQAVRDRFGDRVITGVAAQSAVALRLRSAAPTVLRRGVGRVAGAIAVGHGVGRTVGLPRAVDRTLPVRGDLAQLPRSVGIVPVIDRSIVEVAHGMGIEVHVWTVDEPAAMHRLLDLGVDGLMTDRPDRLRDVLLARGSWPAGADDHPSDTVE